MLINYFSYSSILRIYVYIYILIYIYIYIIYIYKSHDRKDLLSSKFLDKCKKGCKKVMENFRSSTIKIYWTNTTIVSIDPIYIRLALCGKMVGLTALNILRTTRAMSMNFCIVNIPRCQILIWDAKYCAGFSRFLPVKR